MAATDPHSIYNDQDTGVTNMQTQQTDPYAVNAFATDHYSSNDNARDLTGLGTGDALDDVTFCDLSQLDSIWDLGQQQTHPDALADGSSGAWAFPSTLQLPMHWDPYNTVESI